MNEEIILDKFAERFSKLIKNSSIDIPKLAQMLGIKSKSTIYRYMNAEMAPKITTVKCASEIFNVNPLWLMGYDVPMEKEEYVTCEEWDNNNKYVTTKNPDGSISYSIPLSQLYKDKVPLLGTVKAGYNYLANENVVDYIAINFKKENYNYYALKIVGDSMETIMSDGDYVVIQKQNEFNSGDYCVVLINGEEATVKRVFKTDTGIKLVALNSIYKPVDYTFEDIEKIPIEIIGIVKQLIKNFN